MSPQEATLGWEKYYRKKKSHIVNSNSALSNSTTSVLGVCQSVQQLRKAVCIVRNGDISYEKTDDPRNTHKLCSPC